jgi:hypothetical protein
LNESDEIYDFEPRIQITEIKMIVLRIEIFDDENEMDSDQIKILEIFFNEKIQLKMNLNLKIYQSSEMNYLI